MSTDNVIETLKAKKRTAEEELRTVNSELSNVKKETIALREESKRLKENIETLEKTKNEIDTVIKEKTDKLDKALAAIEVQKETVRAKHAAIAIKETFIKNQIVKLENQDKLLEEKLAKLGDLNEKETLLDQRQLDIERLIEQNDDVRKQLARMQEQYEKNLEASEKIKEQAELERTKYVLATTAANAKEAEYEKRINELELDAYIRR